MDDTLRGVVRWVVAAIVMLLVVFITVPLAIDAVTSSIRFGDEEVAVPGEDAEPALEPVTTDHASAIADLSIRDGQVRQAEEEFVAIGGAEGDGLLFAFEQFPGSPECINTVSLLFTTLQITPPTELIVSPSTVTDAPELSDDDDLPDPPYVEDGPSETVTLDGDEGHDHRVIITDLYLAWITGEATDAPDAPFTVTLRPPDALADRRIQVASVDGDDPDREGPILSWSGYEDCGVPAGS
jgi:hypothetical protein